MADGVTTAMGGAKVGADLYKLAKELGWIDKLKLFLKKKKRIIVLGSTGTGKTQFIQSMQELLPQLILRTDRTAFPLTRLLSLGSELFEITDTPGQVAHSARRIDSIKKAMKDANGVINVVSFGYHEWDVSVNAVLTKAGLVREAFLRTHRQREIEALREWSNLLNAGLACPWLITLVTKADLWWQDREAVKEHYESGAYHDSLEEAQSMRPTVCLYSSIRHKFFGTAPVSGLFDDADRLHLRQDFFRVLFEAVGKVT